MTKFTIIILFLQLFFTKIINSKLNEYNEKEIGFQILTGLLINFDSREEINYFDCIKLTEPEVLFATEVLAYEEINQLINILQNLYKITQNIIKIYETCGMSQKNLAENTERLKNIETFQQFFQRGQILYIKNHTNFLKLVDEMKATSLENEKTQFQFGKITGAVISQLTDFMYIPGTLNAQSQNQGYETIIGILSNFDQRLNNKDFKLCVLEDNSSVQLTNKLIQDYFAFENNTQDPLPALNSLVQIIQRIPGIYQICDIDQDIISDSILRTYKIQTTGQLITSLTNLYTKDSKNFYKIEAQIIFNLVNNNDWKAVGQGLGQMIALLVDFEPQLEFNNFLEVKNSYDITFNLQDATELLLGLLRGLNITITDNIKTCTDDQMVLLIEFKKIMSLVQSESYLDKLKIISLLNGLKTIVPQFIIKCKSAFNDLGALMDMIDKLQKPTYFNHLIWKLIEHLGTSYHDITTILKEFDDKNFDQAGFDIGKLINLIQ